MKVVIIGNGPAGITAAKTIKEFDPGIEIHVYSEEQYPYYFRPKLPDLLGGAIQPQQIYAYSEEWYHKRNIKVYLGTVVTQIIPHDKEIVLGTGEHVDYDKLLLATGSHCFIPPIRGVEKKGVFTLRTIDCALKIKEYAKSCKKAIVIGGGLLGLESSRALRSLGMDVTVVEFFPRLLPRQLDEEGATFLKTKIEEMEIGVQLSAASEEIAGYDEVEGLILQDGRKMPSVRPG